MGGALGRLHPPLILITQGRNFPERISQYIAQRVSRQEGLGRGNGCSRFAFDALKSLVLEYVGPFVKAITSASL
jgi:hypothetical protein